MIEPSLLFCAVGERVRTIRHLAGMTQAELATRAALTRTSITHLEAGKQNLSLLSLYMVARALDVPIQMLLPEDTDADQ